MNKLTIEFSIENQPELTAKMNQLQRLVDEINSTEFKVIVKPAESIQSIQENILKKTP